MEAALLGGSIASFLALSGALYRLGSLIGGLSSSIQAIDQDMNDVKSTQATQGDVLIHHGTRLTVLETQSPRRRPTPS